MTSHPIPEILKGLPLYEADETLCKKLPFVMVTWVQMFPHVDIRDQIMWAHAWEMHNEKKKDRVRFLFNWMKRTEEKNRAMFTPTPTVTVAPKMPPPVKYDVPEDEILTGDDFAKLREELANAKRKRKDSLQELL